MLRRFLWAALFIGIGVLALTTAYEVFVHALDLVAGGPPVRVAAGALTATLATALGLLFVLLVRAVEPEEEEGDEELNAARMQTFREVGIGADHAARALTLFWDRERWIKRRVERIAFVDNTLARRRISFDFMVPHVDLAPPAHEHALEADDEARYGEVLKTDEVYLPLSVLRKWPPVLNFDLRDAQDRPIPLVSKVASNQLDEGLLLGAAQRALPQVSEHTERMLHNIVHGEGRIARRAFVVLREAIHEAAQESPDRFDPESVGRLLDLAGALIGSTLLWVRVQGPAGERRIVKMAYDEPVRRRLVAWRGVLTALSFNSHVVDFDVPHIGDAGSYHLEVDAPPGLQVVRARLVLNDDPLPPSRLRWARDRFDRWMRGAEQRIAVALGTREPHVYIATRRRHAEILTSRVHIYSSEDRPRAFGGAFVAFLPARSGVLTANLLIAGFVAAVMTAFNFAATDILASKDARAVGPSVGFLLLAPGLLTYAALRPAEHPFVSKVLTGTRLLALVATALPLLAAASLIAADSGHASALHARHALMHASWVLAGLAVAAWTLPPRRRWRRRD